ncbi:serine/threonine-protein phosphatase, partial [bacterium]|nr:serine/threonine-protein phosphatase [bacterium]
YHHMLVEHEKMNQQLEAAHAIQESFMPQDFPQCLRGRFSVWALNRPARILGGDFYDFFEFKDTDELGLVIGDVSGKGIPAALYMARLVSDLRFNCFMAQTPANCLQAMNHNLSIQTRRGMFVTLLYLILQNATGRLKITNAGHLPLIWFHRATGKAELIQHSSGIPLAVLPEAEFDTRSIQLAHGDGVLMFTDGIIEAKNGVGEHFSMTRLMQSFEKIWQTPEELLDGIADDLAVFSQDTPQHDDMTMVAFTWHRG